MKKRPSDAAQGPRHSTVDLSVSVPRELVEHIAQRARQLGFSRSRYFVHLLRQDFSELGMKPEPQNDEQRN